jgi:hypothetical protein
MRSTGGLLYLLMHIGAFSMAAEPGTALPPRRGAAVPTPERWKAWLPKPCRRITGPVETGRD